MCYLNKIQSARCNDKDSNDWLNIKSAGRAETRWLNKGDYLVLFR